MADDKTYDQLLAGDITNLVDQITNAVRSSTASVFDLLGASYEEKLAKILDQLDEERQDNLDKLLRKMAEYEAKQFIKRYSEEDKINAKATKNAEKIREIEEEERKLKNLATIEENKIKSDAIREELDAYAAMSEYSKETSQMQLDILEKQRLAEKAKAEGKEAEAKQAEKDAAKLKRQLKEAEKKHEVQEVNKDYNMRENLSDKFFSDFKDALNDDKHAQKTLEQNIEKSMKAMADNIKQMANAINNAISSYAKFQTSINARLQGVSSFSEATNVLSKVAFSPLLNAEDLYSNLQSLVDSGIVTNVEQRAMFQTVKDGIAKTFDVTDAALLRMIRLQRNDSTAARLGLEAYLNRFLNVYVENTEYLTSTFDSVASSLFEASALLGQANSTAASLELEYIVQKWLGTLTGLGLSDNAANSIATAIGLLGSGEVDNSMESLMVMAASRANMSYAEMLHQGVTASEANKLLKSIVQYLQELAGYDSNIVKNQLSKIFGVTVSDLIAVTNLSEESIRKIENDILTYDQMYGELEYQFQQLPGRLGIANLLENAFNNLTYQIGMSIGSNAASFAAWKITDLIHSATGGINIPYISAMGTGLDLEVTVERLIQLGLVGIATLGNIGNIISGVASAVDGSILLSKLGVSQSGAELKTLGGGGLLKNGSNRTKGATTSESSYVGNTDSDTYSKSAINQAKEEPQEELNLKEEEAYEKDPVVKYYKTEVELVKRFDSFETYLKGYSNSFNAVQQELEVIRNITARMQLLVDGSSIDMASRTVPGTETQSGLAGFIGGVIDWVKGDSDKEEETYQFALYTFNVDQINQGNTLIGLITGIKSDTEQIVTNTANSGLLSAIGGLTNAFGSSKLTSEDLANLGKLIADPIQQLRALQLAIYQSLVMNTLYTLTSDAKITDMNIMDNSATLINKINSVKTRAQGGTAITTNLNNITPTMGGEFASLSDYLLLIEFADKMTHLDDNVKAIAEKITGDKITYESPAGFTNLMF